MSDIFKVIYLLIYSCSTGGGTQGLDLLADYSAAAVLIWVKTCAFEVGIGTRGEVIITSLQ